MNRQSIYKFCRIGTNEAKLMTFQTKVFLCISEIDRKMKLVHICTIVKECDWNVCMEYGIPKQKCDCSIFDIGMQVVK